MRSLTSSVIISRGSFLLFSIAMTFGVFEKEKSPFKRWTEEKQKQSWHDIYSFVWSSQTLEVENNYNDLVLKVVFRWHRRDLDWVDVINFIPWNSDDDDMPGTKSPMANGPSCFFIWFYLVIFKTCLVCEISTLRQFIYVSWPFSQRWSSRNGWF